MAVTLTQLATSAVEDLGVIDVGEALSAAMIAQALTVANNMLDNWSSQKLLIMRSLLQSLTLADATQSYTVTGSPLKIAAATLKNSAGPSSPIQVVNALEWSRLMDRESNSFLVKYVFYDRAATGKAYFSPIPRGSALTVELTLWVALAQFADATTALTPPPGYQELMQFGLALKLAPKYDVAPTPQLLQNYQEALANVASLNADLFGPDEIEAQTPVAASQPVATP
jgi:hypothetical protein